MKYIALLLLFFISLLNSKAQGLLDSSSFYQGRYRFPLFNYSNFQNVDSVQRGRAIGNSEFIISNIRPNDSSKLVLPMRIKNDTLKAPVLPGVNLLTSWRVIVKKHLIWTERRLESIQDSAKSKLDNLARFSKLDSSRIKIGRRISERSDSVHRRILEVQTKLGHANVDPSLESKFEAPIRNAQKAVERKMSLFQQNGMTGLPSSISLPETSALDLSNAQMGSISLPNGSFPNGSLGNLEVPEVNLPDGGISVPAIPGASLPSIGSIGKLENR